MFDIRGFHFLNKKNNFFPTSPNVQYSRIWQYRQNMVSKISQVVVH